MDRRPIVVGYDGFDSAGAVLSWALDDARARQAPLQVVHAFGTALACGSMAIYGDLPIPDSAAARASSEELVATAVRRMAAAAPDVEISATAIEGDAIDLLLGLASTASTLVLGSRRLGRLGSIVLGSVSATVSARASCPVVVVRDSRAHADGRTAGVVVGVDALQDDIAALEYALRFCQPALGAAASRPVLAPGHVRGGDRADRTGHASPLRGVVG